MQKFFNSKLDQLLFLLFFSLSSFFLFKYLSFYPSYQEGFSTGNNFSSNIKIIAPLFLFLIIWFSLFLYYQNRKITPLRILLNFLGGITLGMILFASIAGGKDIFKNIAVSMVFLNILGTLLLFLIGVILFTLFLTGVGSGILKGIKQQQEKKLPLLSKFFIGFITLSFVGFGLAKIGFFNLEVFLGLFVLLSFVFWKNLKTVFKTIFINREVTLSKTELFLVSLLGSVIVLNFIQSFYPFSVGWDSMNQYLLTVNTLIENGTLRSGLFPPFIEIVLAIFGKFFGLSGVQFLLNFWGSLLIFSFFHLARSFNISRTTSLLLVSSFFVLPTISFQLSRDLKLDLIFLQLILTAILLWKQKAFPLSAFLFGFAVLCKLTALWLFPFLILLFLFIPNQSKNQFKRLKKSGYLLLLLGLPIGFWSIINVLDVGHFPKNLNQARIIFLQGKIETPVLKITPTKTQSHQKIVSTAFREEVSRYSGFKTHFLEKVWAIFSSPEIPDKNKQYVDLGFLWLGNLIFLIFGFLIFWKKIKQEYKWFLGLGLSFFFFWISIGQGIAWYGLPFLALLYLLSASFISTQPLKRTSQAFTFFLIISLLLGIFSRLEHSFKQNFLTTISWATFPTNENKERLENSFFNEEKQAAAILNKDKTSKILRVGTMARFFIQNGENRIFEDPQLDLFQQLTIEADTLIILDRLTKNNIRYLLIDRGATSIEKNPEGSLHQKFKKLESFLERSLVQKKIQLLINGNRIVLIKVSSIKD